MLPSYMSRTCSSSTEKFAPLDARIFHLPSGVMELTFSIWTYRDDNNLLFTIECEQDDLKLLDSIFQIAPRTCMPGCEHCSVRLNT